MTRRLRPTGLAAIWVIALVLLIVGEGCAPAPESSLVRVSHPTTLVGTTWRLVSVGGVAVPAGTTASLAFGPTDLSGDSSCNAFGGTYADDPASGAVRIDGLVSTKRACLDPGFNGVESAVFAALRGVADASIDPNGRLVLTGAGPALAFEVGPRGVPVGSGPP